ncbi:hypothetical protein P7228_06705 [Altererythrobacter arenosus]|uniref:Uncharacterized protein n=1 Tax=Altererythrobacter arenosus TaxID=3032592 RepID=A0ABY8FUR8_9SPHN|nr:hypothetical protein [Altererythrobacter sp. CAU 1644]WFL78748.1 hypothetical protein P7228_06705 [Altererythrobacter sp. CAU 1644]
MKRVIPPPLPSEVRLDTGAQAVVNGALVTAVTPCWFEVGSGGFVLTGRGLWPDRPAVELTRELYLLLIEASLAENGLEARRKPLFDLLGRAVAQMRTHEAQSECSLCAAAILSGDLDAALGSARRLTASQDRPVARRTTAPHPARLLIRDST